MVSVNVAPGSTIRKRDRLKNKIQKVFKPKDTRDEGTILELRVAIDNAEQSLSGPEAEMASWNVPFPL